MKKITLISTIVFALAIQSCEKKIDSQSENTEKSIATLSDSLAKQNDSLPSQSSQKNGIQNNDLLFDIVGTYQSQEITDRNMNLKLYYNEGTLKSVQPQLI